MEQEYKPGYIICQENDFPLAEYKNICGAEVPICTSKMIECDKAGIEIQGILLCKGAIKRDMQSIEKEVKHG